MWAEGSEIHGDLVLWMLYFGKHRVNKMLTKHSLLPFFFAYAWKTDKQDCQWYKQPIWPRAEVGVKQCSFADAQTFDWLPTLISTKAPVPETVHLIFTMSLKQSQSSLTFSVWTDSGSTHERQYMPSLAKWPWTGLAFVFLWRAQGRPPLWCWHHMLLKMTKIFLSS